MNRLKRKESVMLEQANVITRSRYDFTAVEKNVLYIVIDKIQALYKLGKLDKDLFGMTELVFQKDELLIAGKNYREVLDACRSLRKKELRFYQYHDNFELSSEVITGFFSSVVKRKGSTNVSIRIDDILMPAYIDIIGKYTKFDAVVAISLNSIWAKRFYELGASWKSNGSWYMTIEQLESDFQLENSYRQKDGSKINITLLKKRVLDVAMKEIKSHFEQQPKHTQNDFYLSYVEKTEKQKRGRPKTIGFYFNIHTRKKHSDLTYDDMRYNIKQILTGQFPTNPHLVDATMKQTKSEEMTTLLYERIQKKYKDKNINNFPAVLFTMLTNDFKVDYDVPEKPIAVSNKKPKEVDTSQQIGDLFNQVLNQ